MTASGFKSPVVTYGQSGGSIRLYPGTPVYRDNLGQFRAASAASLTTAPAIGIVAKNTLQNYTVNVISTGYLTLYNWVSITGTVSLTLGATYYLAVASGKLTTNSAESGSLVTQAIGLATSVNTLQVLGNVSVSPPTGITLEVTVAEDLIGAYWVLDFHNGLLYRAVHHDPPAAMDVVLADGTGAFWKLAVNSAGQLGTQPDAGPASADVILEDEEAGFWKIVVNPAGVRGTESHAGPATISPALTDELGGTWELVVNASGLLGTRALA